MSSFRTFQANPKLNENRLLSTKQTAGAAQSRKGKNTAGDFLLSVLKFPFPHNENH